MLWKQMCQTLSAPQLLCILITTQLNIKGMRGRWNDRVCQSSESGSAGHRHPPWKVHVYTEHMDVLSRHHNTVQAHLEVCDIRCDKLQWHALQKGKTSLCPPQPTDHFWSAVLTVPLLLCKCLQRKCQTRSDQACKNTYGCWNPHRNVQRHPLNACPEPDPNIPQLYPLEKSDCELQALSVGNPPAGVGEQYSKVKQRGVPAVEASSNFSFPLTSWLYSTVVLLFCFF